MTLDIKRILLACLVLIVGIIFSFNLIQLEAPVKDKPGELIPLAPRPVVVQAMNDIKNYQQTSLKHTTIIKNKLICIENECAALNENKIGYGRGNNSQVKALQAAGVEITPDLRRQLNQNR